MAGGDPLPPGTGPAQRAVTFLGSDVQRSPDNRDADAKPGAREDQREYSDEELLEEAREFFEHAGNVEDGNINRASEMIRFSYRRGAQWPDRVRREREADNRPVLEFNQMPSCVNQLANDFRQNRPAIKVRGASDDATEEMACIRQDLIRHIEYDSSADQAYDTAFRYMVIGGFGFIRVLTDYEAEDDFNQKIVISPVTNPLSVYFDPDCDEPDGSDAEACLVTEEMDHEEFYRRWPKARPVDWAPSEPKYARWIRQDSVTVADYYHKVYWKDTLYKLTDGSVAWESEIKGDKPKEADDAWQQQQQLAQMVGLPPDQTPHYVAKRTVDRCSVRWEKINGVEVLERHEWAGTLIPIIPVWGDVTQVDGEILRQGLIERAQDAQQMYNFWLTTAAEVATMRTKSPWLVAEGMTDGRAREWGQANVKPYPFITYRRYDEDNKDLGQPIPNNPDLPVDGILEQANLCLQQIRMTIGLPDPQAMMQTQDESGRAILAKERVSATSTFHFLDNFSRAQKLLGRVILDLVPHIYDAPRTLQLLREDGEEYQQAINQDPNFVQDAFAMDQGDYDIVIDTGPSYQSKRVEFVNAVSDLVQAHPDSWPIMADKAIRAMDWPYAEEIADRFKVMLPPPIQMLEAQKSKDPQVIGLTQQLQQVQQQSQQQIQAMGSELTKLQQDNARLQTQVAQAKLAEAKASSQGQYAELQGKMAEAHADIVTQQMESTDVAERLNMDKAELQHKASIERGEFALKIADLALQLVNAQQKQMQPVGPEFAQLDKAATQVVGAAQG
jgi:hypothetical protein